MDAERLTSRTVFHEINLKRDEVDSDSEFEGDVTLPDPELEHVDAREADNSDAEWDTDLEEDGQLP